MIDKAVSMVLSHVFVLIISHRACRLVHFFVSIVNGVLLLLHFNKLREIFIDAFDCIEVLNDTIDEIDSEYEQ